MAVNPQHVPALVTSPAIGPRLAPAANVPLHYPSDLAKALGQVVAAKEFDRDGPVMQDDRGAQAITRDQFGPAKEAEANSGGLATGPIIDPIGFPIAIAGTTGVATIKTTFGNTGTAIGTITIIGTTTTGGITITSTIRTIPISTIGVTRRGRR